MVEVAHPDLAVSASNALSRARVNVHYLGSPTVGTPTKNIATISSYSRMIAFDTSHDLVALFLAATRPTGTDVAASLQICSDATGATCQAALTPAELAAAKPVAQFVKATVTFSSDGLAVPMLDTLTLRYKK
jgi:hypothetical protein